MEPYVTTFVRITNNITAHHDWGTAIETLEGTEVDARTRRLWLSVLLRAKEDADCRDMMCEDERHERKLADDAREWLVTDSTDFRVVCHFAGRDWKTALEYFRREYGM